jgi:Arc/MetJ-type ribon-helix-helix transcriptional regulator
MAVELKPETARLVREEIERGHFRSLDELIVQSVHAWREQSKLAQSGKPRKALYDLLTQPPFAGSDLQIERQNDAPRPVDL